MLKKVPPNIQYNDEGRRKGWGRGHCTAQFLVDHLTQFSVNTFKEDWESFNECCNRTENSFFIDLDGTPVIQKNSHWIANPLNTTSEGKPIDFFLGDSAFSETLGYDTNVNDQNEKWYETLTWLPRK